MDKNSFATLPSLFVRHLTAAQTRHVMEDDPAEKVARRIKSGENSGLLERLKRLCSNYLRKVASTNGYGFVTKNIREFFSLVGDGIDIALATWEPGEHRFIMVLRFRFLKECRQFARQQRFQRLWKLGESAEKEENPLASLEDKTGETPAGEVEKRELISIVKEELHNESERSRCIVLGWMKGLPYKRIAPSVDVDSDRCRKVRWENMQRIQRNLRDRCGSLLVE